MDAKPQKYIFWRAKPMNDIIRRALVGDREAQEECTKQGIVLPCPFCGGEAELKQLSGRWAVCCKTHCVGTKIHGNKAKALTAWNARQAPPREEAGHEAD